MTSTIELETGMRPKDGRNWVRETEETVCSHERAALGTRAEGSWHSVLQPRPHAFSRSRPSTEPGSPRPLARQSPYAPRPARDPWAWYAGVPRGLGPAASCSLSVAKYRVGCWWELPGPPISGLAPCPC